MTELDPSNPEGKVIKLPGSVVREDIDMFADPEFDALRQDLTDPDAMSRFATVYEFSRRQPKATRPNQPDDTFEGPDAA